MRGYGYVVENRQNKNQNLILCRKKRLDKPANNGSVY